MRHIHRGSRYIHTHSYTYTHWDTLCIVLFIYIYINHIEHCMKRNLYHRGILCLRFRCMQGIDAGLEIGVIISIAGFCGFVLTESKDRIRLSLNQTSKQLLFSILQHILIFHMHTSKNRNVKHTHTYIYIIWVHIKIQTHSWWWWGDWNINFDTRTVLQAMYHRYISCWVSRKVKETVLEFKPINSKKWLILLFSLYSPTNEEMIIITENNTLSTKHKSRIFTTFLWIRLATIGLVVEEVLIFTVKL